MFLLMQGFIMTGHFICSNNYCTTYKYLNLQRLFPETPVTNDKCIFQLFKKSDRVYVKTDKILSRDGAYFANRKKPINQ